MASRAPSASTRKKAQVILSCQLCQRSSPLKWKCLDCDILMCDNCKINVHSKVKTTKIHKTVDIKDVDISQPKELSVDLDNIPCKTHRTQSCCVYCVQCKELICPKCLKTHKGHDVEEIETQYNLEYLRKNIAGNIDPHDLFAIFGSFDQQSIITNPEKINLKKTNTYETNLPFVHRLVTTSVNSIWITCYETTVSGLQEMQIAQELKAIREYNYRTIFDMTISKTGDLLLTLSEDSHLYRLDTTGKMNIVHDFSPLLPKAINVSDDSITVSTREKGPTFPLTVHSRRQVVILNQTGKKKVRVIENDKQKRRLFSFLSRITSDKTGNIVGMDNQSNGSRRIMKVVKKSIEWIYEGSSDNSIKVHPFTPADLVMSPMGNIIVCDLRNHSLHILSEDGEAIKCCVMEEINILFPRCLYMDLNGNLWIGCFTDEDSADDCKIHKLEITGC